MLLTSVQEYFALSQITLPFLHFFSPNREKRMSIFSASYSTVAPETKRYLWKHLFYVVHDATLLKSNKLVGETFNYYPEIPHN